MFRRIIFLLALLVAGCAVGCSARPTMRAEPVAVNGVVLLPSGVPARNVTVNFLPTNAGQMQGGAQLKEDGKFSAKLNAGKYTFAFEGTPAALRAIPLKYHTNSLDNTFEVPSSGQTDLTIRLTN